MSVSVSPFASEDYKSPVVLYIASDKGIRVVSREKWDTLSPIEQKKYAKYTVTLRALTWGETCDLQSRSTKVDKELNQRVFDPEQFVKQKLRKIILAWDFFEEVGGQTIPVALTEDTVDSLHAAVANFLLDKYRSMFEYDWEKEKNF